MDQDVYLIQDSRQYVGNCVLWWREQGHGYTTNIDEAGHFSRDEALAQQRSRNTDIPRRLNDALAVATRTVDMQKLNGR